MDLTMVISIVSGFVSTIVGAYVAAKVRKLERIEQRLEERTEQVIDQKFAAMESGCTLKHSAVAGEFRRIEQRLEKGDAAFHGMDEKTVESRVALVRAVADLRDYVRDNSATKGEISDLKSQVSELQRSIAALAGRFEGMQQAVAREMMEKPVRVRT